MSTETPPQDCQSMAEVRAQIDRLDIELVQLLAARAGYIDRAIRLKQANGWPARIPERVEEVVMNARAAAEGEGLDPDLIEGLWRQLVDWSIAREARVIREE
ncbi:chorismate mutase [Leisingera sp. HS039]|uniref:chorismate mutase n=1 Tax=unclassified Leisingera TaxID=2614906 RepID=UPI001070C1DB|nr:MULTISPECIES: chorismate mutase [unclassified Leisingera]MBQ4827598.1 chorismate mutase [Leisingera sp. HS039]QBR34828.1 chorismate mutase family protein [Leisingera sp. NJS201]QBR35513.1 chorismate mutase family protein [Leisingera sp. NJS201]